MREFDRLYKTNLVFSGSPLDLAIDEASGRLDADAAAFAAFVRDTIYERLPPQVLAALRKGSFEC
ncbi:hypothetical protein [Rubrivivax gelatinosus]|uniref:hypothetical protein n=1 Tax=Rubrivivax gelatinosus TaxID=28068 RepID=UPI001ED8C025|nr:hypothetical protein [Rubrivivax gelatinosus]